MKKRFFLVGAALLSHALVLAVPRMAPTNDIHVTVSPSSDQQVEFHYSLPADGFVTLVIDNAQGRRIRNLIGAGPRKAGDNVETWDGTDDQGQVVPAGAYRWSILRHNGVDVDYIFSYGNPGTPPWATADGRGGWGADHTNPQAAVTTPNGVILGWPTAEAGWFLTGIGLDGHKEWGLKNHYTFGDTLVTLAADSQYLYVASEQNAGPLMKYYKKLANAVLCRYRLSDRKLVNFGNADEIIVSDKMDGNVKGVAVFGQTAYVALSKENRIATISLTEGRATPDKDIAVPAPAGLAMEKSGFLLALSGQQLLRIDLNTRKSRPLISEGLEEPIGLAVDSAGKIFVSDRGRSQQVKVFDSNGRFLRSIGVAGGRPPRGPHQPLGMYRPFGITVDAQGELWVMEEDDRPKRVSVWNAATGALIREYIGAPHYGAQEGSVAEFDRTMGFAEGSQYLLDWEKKTSHLVTNPGHAANDEDVFGRAAIRQLFQRNGRILTASNAHVQVIGELKNGFLQPLAAIGEIDELTRRLNMYTGAIERKIEQMKASGSKLDAKGNPVPGAAFIWIDQNGDGIPQDSEFVWKDKLRWGGYWGTAIGDDFTVYMQSDAKIYRLPVTGWNPRGAPVYTFESATTIPFSGHAEHVRALPDGMLVVNARPQLLGIGLATKQQVWSYPNPWQGVQGSHNADVPAPGRLIGPLAITGVANVGGQVGTLFAMNGNLSQHFLMTSDGLWVAAVLKDWRLAKEEDMYSVPDEDFGGYFWRDKSSGEVYLQAGKAEYRLYRVTGLDTIRRSEGEFAFSSELGRAAATRIAGRSAPREGVPSVAIARIDAPLKIAGKLEDLPKNLRFTEVVADPGSKFRFALAHDEQNLYLAYDVTDDAPFQNNGRNEKQMFTTGDCVDFMFGVDPKANPRRREGAAGDNRLLLTIKDGKPLAMLYKQVDPGHAGSVFASPTRAAYFGSVTKVQNVEAAVTHTKSGYLFMAAVPLAALGINPEAAKSFLAGDVGIIYGSQSGNGARLRLYWANKSTAITSDIPSEAALDPENWGRFQFE